MADDDSVLPLIARLSKALEGESAQTDLLNKITSMPQESQADVEQQVAAIAAVFAWLGYHIDQINEGNHAGSA